MSKCNYQPQSRGGCIMIPMTTVSVSHDWQEETLEAKVRWFRSLTLPERMELLCSFTEMLLATNPKIVEQQHAQPVAGRVRVVSAA